jgi:hypothetical protein
MAGGIYMRREGELVRMNEQAYATEDQLQELLGRHPDLLSADGEPRRWLLIAREFGIASERDGSERWSVDHLFIDEQAIPTLVEVKRSTDTRIRREVVGQMLDYAANALSHWKLETIRARFEASCGERDPESVIADALGDGMDLDDFWSRVETNLAAGRMRLMFVADVIPNELRAIVEFLNQHMAQVEVLALELKQYVGDSPEHQTLVSRLIGETQAARQAKGRSERVVWDRSSWLAAYRSMRGDRELAVVERLLEWADHHTPSLDVGFGTTKLAGAKIQLTAALAAFTIFPGFSAGYLELPFAELAQTAPFQGLESRRELQRQFRRVPGAVFPDERLDKYPRVPVLSLADDSAYDHFIGTLDGILAAVLASSTNIP